MALLYMAPYFYFYAISSFWLNRHLTTSNFHYFFSPLEITNSKHVDQLSDWVKTWFSIIIKMVDDGYLLPSVKSLKE